VPNVSIIEWGETVTQLDLQCIRQSIQQRIGSKVKISSNRGRHKFVTSQGTIAETYPNIFLVEIEDESGKESKTVSFSYQDVVTKDVRMMLLEG
jgi:uncharacterized protein Veg